jgi:hypothetical protein
VSTGDIFAVAKSACDGRFIPVRPVDLARHREWDPATRLLRLLWEHNELREKSFVNRFATTEADETDVKKMS